MKTKTEKILSVLRVLAWLGVFGYAIDFGSQVICFVVSFKNPAAAKQIPDIAQNLSNLMNYNFSFYVFAMIFVMALSAMFIYLWYQVAELLSKLSVESPFTIQVAQKLNKIAYWLVAIWVVSVIGKIYTGWLSKHIGGQLNLITIGNEFLFTAGIVFIVSQIFRRGIEIQEENQQTI